MKNIILLFLVSIIIYGCGSSNKTYVLYQEAPHEHTISFDTLKKEILFNRFIKWFNYNNSRFIKSVIDKQDKTTGVIVYKLTVENKAYKNTSLKYLAFTLKLEIQDYKTRLVFSDLIPMDVTFKKYTTASDGGTTELADREIFDKMIAEIVEDIKTYKDF